MHRNKSIDVHRFAMTPRAEIPRSSFRIQTTHKTTFDGGYLIPVYCDEVLPGDTFKLKMTTFARLATPLFPLMDNLHLDTFFFFVPMRLVWTNWVKFMGEQTDPGDSIDYTIPISTTPTGGYAINSLQDYFGLPTVGQVEAASTVNHNTLPLRCYNLIYNEWFRDENLQDSIVVDKDDGPDTVTDYVLRRRGKRHDYFTSALPWPQKGDTGVSIPLGSEAPVVSKTGAQARWLGRNYTTGALEDGALATAASTGYLEAAGSGIYLDPQDTLYTDLSTATAATINQLRQSFQIQKLLERDARGGTRYTEIIRSHFGVVSPDARLQRPEYLGGGSVPISITPVQQTSATNIGTDDTPLGELAAIGQVVARNGFTQSFTEHGYIIGLVSVRADLTYQQGLRRMWSRSTRYDFYFPAFAMLGEQAVLSKEIYCDGQAADEDVWGYQERWAEYRYHPAMITGLFRSTAANTIDPWHAAQDFASRPTLNTTFIQDTPPIERIVAVGASAAGKQFLFDSFFDIQATRPMPLYSVPGLIDHF